MGYILIFTTEKIKTLGRIIWREHEKIQYSTCQRAFGNGNFEMKEAG